jgi:hypothetical protein
MAWYNLRQRQKLSAAAINNGTACKVDLSTQTKSLSVMPPLMFPSRENVQKLSSSSLVFNGADVQVNADGELWLSSKE